MICRGVFRLHPIKNDLYRRRRHVSNCRGWSDCRDKRNCITLEGMFSKDDLKCLTLQGSVRIAETRETVSPWRGWFLKDDFDQRPKNISISGVRSDCRDKRNCITLEGMHQCSGGICLTIEWPYNCTRCHNDALASDCWFIASKQKIASTCTWCCFSWN